MGRHPTAGTLSTPGEALDDGPRLYCLDGGTGDRRSGDAVEVDRSDCDLSLSPQRPIRARRLQRCPAHLPPLGRPAATADPARRCALARFGVAAAGAISASVFRARHARHRPARDEMPNGMIGRRMAVAAGALLWAVRIAAAD